jgi:glutathione S-transferase
MSSSPEYELLYWPVPGRGEFIRLAFEEAKVSYKEHEVGDVLAQLNEDYDHGDNTPPLAPPFLKHGNVVLSQTSNILFYLGPQLGLAPPVGDDVNRCQVNQLTLTALDLADEMHNVHHPISVLLYYEDQKNEAARAAEHFRETRLPRFFGYFNRVLKKNTEKSGSQWLVGKNITYADLVLFQVVDGLRFAYPKAAENELGKFEQLKAHYQSIKERPNIKAYLESERRRPYGNDLYRHYPELDA